MPEEPDFGNFPYGVCMYCNKLLVFKMGGGMDYGDEYSCKIQKENTGRYSRLGNIILEGCKKFESSGLPAHPIVLQELVNINPLTSSILSDENATEDLYDFADKIKEFLPEEQVFRNKDKLGT